MKMQLYHIRALRHIRPSLTEDMAISGCLNGSLTFRLRFVPSSAHQSLVINVSLFAYDKIALET